MNNDELDESLLADINGGLDRDTAIEIGKRSKFKEVREMADAENLKLASSEVDADDSKEYTEEELDQMAYNYYHNNEETITK
ncbi:MAG: hypothetical protein IJK67_00480 [Bacilli bacterium]|nr:hypothetical protein [Bacilli bacterium]